MVATAYAALPRLQKLAMFLIVIGPEAAADVLRQFDDAEIEKICREMGQVSVVTPDLRAAVLEEFGPVIGDSAGCLAGGLGYARRTLGLARGDYKADLLLKRVGAESAATSSDHIADIAELSGRQIFNLLRDEQPQTMAFVLSHLAPPKAAEVFMQLPPAVRDEVLERLGTIEGTPRDLVAKIVGALARYVSKSGAPAYHTSGGVRAVADLLNNVDKENSKTLLGRVEERNSRLGAAVRKKMFSFDDIRRLTLAELQRIMREVDSAHLATAMKSASEALREKIYASMSKRAAESLREEISMLGPVRLKEIETAQDAIIIVVRRLEEEGAISLGAEEGAVIA